MHSGETPKQMQKLQSCSKAKGALEMLMKTQQRKAGAPLRANLVFGTTKLAISAVSGENLYYLNVSFFNRLSDLLLKKKRYWSGLKVGQQ